MVLKLDGKAGIHFVTRLLVRTIKKKKENKRRLDRFMNGNDGYSSIQVNIT